MFHVVSMSYLLYAHDIASLEDHELTYLPPFTFCPSILKELEDLLQRKVSSTQETQNDNIEVRDQ